MNVADLKKILKDFPGNTPVILMRDPEGNGFAEADGADEAYWDDVNEECPHPDDIGDDHKSMLTRCVVLWPNR